MWASKNKQLVRVVGTDSRSRQENGVKWGGQVAGRTGGHKRWVQTVKNAFGEKTEGAVLPSSDRMKNCQRLMLVSVGC